MRTVQAIIAILHFLVVPLRLFSQEIADNKGWYGEIGCEVPFPVGRFSDLATVGFGFTGMIGAPIAPSTALGLQFASDFHSPRGELDGAGGIINAGALYLGVHHVTGERLPFAGESRISLLAGLGYGYCALDGSNVNSGRPIFLDDSDLALQLAVGVLIKVGSENTSQHMQPAVRYRTLIGGDIRAAALELNVSFAGWI